MKYLVTKDEFSMMNLENMKAENPDIDKLFTKLPSDKVLYVIADDYEFPKLEKDKLLEQYYIDLEITHHLKRIKEDLHIREDLKLELNRPITPAFTQNYEVIDCDSDEEAILFYELY